MIKHNRTLEIVVLALAYHHPRRLTEIQSIVKAEHFFHEDTREVWNTMMRLFQERRDVRTGILLESKRFAAVVAEIQASAIPDADPESYCRDLVKLWKRNQGMKIAERLINAFGDASNEPEELCGKATRTLDELASGTASNDTYDADAVTIAIRNDWDRRLQIDESLNTNIPKLNEAIGGFQGGDLIILGARPSTGKTSMALNWCRRWASMGKRVLVVSLETTAEKLQERMIAAEACVNGHRLTSKRSAMTDEETDRVFAALPRVAWKNLIYIDQPRVSVDELSWRSDSARHRMGGLDAIVIDYLQLLDVDMRRKNYSSNDRVAEISKRLKALAKRNRCPVIALSQLNREPSGGQPQLQHLRESGQLEQDADVVLLMWRVDKEKQSRREYWIKVAKQRNGPLASVELYFDGEHFEFWEKTQLEEAEGGLPS